MGAFMLTVHKRECNVLTLFHATKLEKKSLSFCD